MAAGGFKTFTTGEVLTSADTNNFLMQGVLVFDDATARDAAITAPVEGQVVYLKDTNQVLSYDGSTYVAVGGVSPLTTKGDLYTFSTVDARLPVGTDGQILTANSSTATGLAFATPAAAAFVGVRVRSNASAQVVANATAFTVTWQGTEDFDTDGFHNAVINTSRLTVPAGLGGYYAISGVVQFSTLNGTGRRAFGMSVNGSNISTAETAPSNVSLVTANMSTIFELDAGDFVEMNMFQESGGNMSAMGNTQLSFDMWRIAL